MYNFKPRETKAAQSKQVVANEDEAEPQQTQCFQNPFEVAPQFLLHNMHIIELWGHTRDIHIECSNNSNETHTFLCLGRAGRFWQH